MAKSVRQKLMLIILATTFIALLLSACMIVAYDAYTYRQSWTNDLTAQADIIARASAPAVSFADPAVATENLNALKVRPSILAGAIYLGSGKRFAKYVNPNEPTTWLPDQPLPFGVQILHNRLIIFHPIRENNEVIGTVYLAARYELIDRVNNYLLVLIGALLASMAIAAAIAARLQGSITKPILAITEVADKVMKTGDFTLRAEKKSDDEIGVLVEAFNRMLEEVSQRANDLEESNRSLAQEMITRRNAEEELLQADRRKDEFLAMLAHELRNPLAPISAAAQLLGMVSLDSSRVQQTSEVINRQVAHMTNLINDLLDVSRVTRGLISIEKKPQNINRIISEAVEQVRPLIKVRRHELDIQLSAAPLYILGDFKRMVQIVANILNNAAKYTPEGGRITVASQATATDATISVRDNGQGIPTELLSRVFDLFTQAQRSSDRSLGGLGLGLALVKSLVEAHGGTVLANSAGIDQGSEFAVRIPRLAGNIGQDSVASDRGVITAQGSKALRIFVVDDNVDAANMLTMFLKATGHDVTCENSPETALMKVAAEKPDVCLLDIGLPRIDGYEMARRIRAMPQMQDAMLIAITGYGQPKDIEQARLAGLDHHLTKPVNTERLVSLLSEVTPS